MKFKFIGQYTGGRTSINVGGSREEGGVTFEGNEPAEVTDKELIRRLSGNVEFEAVGKAEDASEDGLKGLRAKYQKKFGKKPFGGWDAATLTQKIDE